MRQMQDRAVDAMRLCHRCIRLEANDVSELIVIPAGIPEELGGADVVFSNVFVREERPGTLSVLLLHAETRTLLAPGDRFELGAKTYRLEAIEERGERYAVVVARLDEAAPILRPGRSEPTSFVIPPIRAHDLGTLLRSLSPTILARLAGDAKAPAIASWTREARDSMNTEWNGEQVGPITTTRHVARFSVDGATEASVDVIDIRYQPEEIVRQEVSAYWRTGGAKASIFLRAEGTGPMTRLLAGPDSDWLVSLICSSTAGRTN
jgi:hypothetical protein